MKSIAPILLAASVVAQDPADSWLVYCQATVPSKLYLLDIVIKFFYDVLSPES
jgi:hypothetical protein